MKLVKVECDFLVVRIPIPIRGTETDYGVLMVSLETDTGLQGVGFAREHDLHALGTRQLVLNDIASFLKDMDEIDVPGRFWHDASYDLQRSDYRAPTGIAARAASAVDQALWDIRGKALGEPVYRLLGGSQSEIEIYATFGLNIYTPEEEAEAARWRASQGFTSFKLQGAHADRGRDVGVDIRRVKALRETVGDDARIILDGRNNYSLYQATELARRIEPYNVAYFDEPLYAKDPVALLQLRRAVPGVPLAGRSRGGNIWDTRDLIVTGALDVIGSNVLDHGGFTQSIKMAHLAEVYQLPMVTGGAWHLQNAHLIAAATNGWMTEYHSMAAAICERLFVDPIMPANGRIRLSDRPGLGLTLNEDVVRDAKKRGLEVDKAVGYV
jgi:L-rhamnonate dehydratase